MTTDDVPTAFGSYRERRWSPRTLQEVGPAPNPTREQILQVEQPDLGLRTLSFGANIQPYGCR
jgi:hypothetical protein